MIAMDALKGSDREIYDLVKKEIEREEYSLILIASENLVYEEILEAQGTVLTNKYAEGYPERRFYGGCRFVDRIEQVAVDRARRAFWSGTRQRTAPFRLVRQHGRALRDAEAG